MRKNVIRGILYSLVAIFTPTITFIMTRGVDGQLQAHELILSLIFTGFVTLVAAREFKQSP